MDDDATLRHYLFDRVTSRGHRILYLESEVQLFQRLDTSIPPSLMLLNLQISDTGGLELLARLQGVGCRIPSIVLSPVAHVPTVVRAMQMGAADYIVKPIQEADLDIALTRFLTTSLETESGRPAFVTAFQTSNRRMLRIREICDKVAATDVPILVLGESGVGKEVVSRYIHVRSGRPEPIIKVNCAALPTELLESELFGHERGAFTGAARDRPGKFELAGQGTIILDEVAEMSPALQAKLLHVLQDGEYCRLGGVRTLRSQARIIAATNKNLDVLVANGGFREDLYFRLNVINVEIPPLRDRREDIASLCDFFVRQYRSKYSSGITRLPLDLLKVFVDYHWPGNVRQLENAVKRFLILRDVRQAIAEFEHKNVGLTVAPPNSSANVSLKELASSAAEQTEREVIFRTLNEVNWNRRKAARHLGICYKSLLNKLRRWQVEAEPPIIGNVDSPSLVVGKQISNDPGRLSRPKHNTAVGSA